MFVLAILAFKSSWETLDDINVLPFEGEIFFESIPSHQDDASPVSIIHSRSADETTDRALNSSFSSSIVFRGLTKLPRYTYEAYI